MKKKLEEMYEQSFSNDEPMNISFSAPTNIEETESADLGNSASIISMITLKPGEIYTECEASIDVGGCNNYYDTRQDYDNFNVNNYEKNYYNNYDREESNNNCDMDNHDGNYREDYHKRQDNDNFNVNNNEEYYHSNYEKEESYNNCDMNSYGENYDENKYYDSCRMDSYDERNDRKCGGLGYAKDYSKNYVQNVDAEIRNEGYNLYGWNNGNFAYQRSRTDNQGILIIIVILLWLCYSPGIGL